MLAVYYSLRGLALLAVPALLGPSVEPPLLVVIALFGLDWVATVPPTVVLSARRSGRSAAASCSGGSSPRT